MHGAINPQSAISDSDQLFNALYSSLGESEWALNLARQKLVSIERMENPLTHSAVTLDCAHCHVTGPARSYITANLKATKSKFPSREATMVARFQLNAGESFNLKNVSATRDYTRAVRAFGYYGSLPSVNQRTIHESAQVARLLNSGAY
jgi:hypothetical protein